jgi:hypothetical protein
VNSRVLFKPNPWVSLHPRSTNEHLRVRAYVCFPGRKFLRAWYAYEKSLRTILFLTNPLETLMHMWNALFARGRIPLNLARVFCCFLLHNLFVPKFFDTVNEPICSRHDHDRCRGLICASVCLRDVPARASGYFWTHRGLTHLQGLTS